jgi:hypothetical protein
MRTWAAIAGKRIFAVCGCGSGVDTTFGHCGVTVSSTFRKSVLVDLDRRHEAEIAIRLGFESHGAHKSLNCSGSAVVVSSQLEMSSEMGCRGASRSRCVPGAGCGQLTVGGLSGLRAELVGELGAPEPASRATALLLARCARCARR